MSYRGRGGHGYGNNRRGNNNFRGKRSKQNKKKDIFVNPDKKIGVVESLPKEVNEEKKTTIGFNIGNQALNFGVTVGRETNKKIIFSEEDKSKQTKQDNALSKKT